MILPWRTELARVLARAERGDEATKLALEEARVARAFASVRAEGVALAAAGTITRDVATLRRAVELLEHAPPRASHCLAPWSLPPGWAPYPSPSEPTTSWEPPARAREIADTLVVTPKTIEWHLGRIYGKLGVGGRRQLATVEFGGRD